MQEINGSHLGKGSSGTCEFHPLLCVLWVCDEEGRHLSNQGHNIIMTINLWLCIVDGTGRLKTSRSFFRDRCRAELGQWSTTFEDNKVIADQFQDKPTFQFLGSTSWVIRFPNRVVKGLELSYVEQLKDTRTGHYPILNFVKLVRTAGN